MYLLESLLTKEKLTESASFIQEKIQEFTEKVEDIEEGKIQRSKRRKDVKRALDEIHIKVKEKLESLPEGYEETAEERAEPPPKQLGHRTQLLKDSGTKPPTNPCIIMWMNEIIQFVYFHSLIYNWICWFISSHVS